MSTEESDAYEHTRKEEAAQNREEAAIEAWKASKTIDILADITADLGEHELLSIETLRAVRLDVDRMAAFQRDSIIKEWEQG